LLPHFLRIVQSSDRDEAMRGPPTPSWRTGESGPPPWSTRRVRSVYRTTRPDDDDGVPANVVVAPSVPLAAIDQLVIDWAAPLRV
jgi:hypothetical protein